MSQNMDDPRASARDFAMCAFCPKMCRAVCPVGIAEYRETTTTWGKMWLAYRAIEHGLAVDSETTAVFDACTGCGACAVFCEHGVDAATALFRMRGAAYRAGVSCRAQELAECFDSNLRCNKENLNALYRAECDVNGVKRGLLVGEASLVRRPGLTRLCAQVMRDIGLDVASLPESAIAAGVGQSLYWSGLFERFDSNAHSFARAISHFGSIVCLEPEDAYFLTHVYPHRGVCVAPRVTTVVEELARLLDRLQVQEHVQLAYHDPCYLGRHMGVYVAPRRIIEHVCGAPALEFTWNHEHAECVCGGGLYPQANPVAARRAATRRWHSLPEFASGIVSACPQAEALLLDVGADVRDIVELVAGCRLTNNRE